MKREELQKEQAPLYEALYRYKNSRQASFHVPGHKKGRAYAASSGGAGFLEQIMEADVTEISGTDDLHHPEGVIRDAQLLAAECFGAEESFFLVGGSTSGNLAMILTVCEKLGDILLVQRNVHKSVLNGLMLAGARAVFLQPQQDKSSGLVTAPAPETITAALDAYPEAKGVLVTMPNYYGMGTDLTPIVKACHRHHVPLLVDEAHGAHYGQHPQLPQSALASGADVVVQSTHKMLAALTMGAMLHVQGPRVNRGLLRQRLAMVQSSSPSYPVMGSLDLARRLLHVQGAGAFTAGLAAVEDLKRGLAELPRYGLLHPQEQQGEAADAAVAAYTTQDPFKVVIYDRMGILSGYELQHRLEANGCIPEMSDDRYVVLLYSLGSTQEDTRHLLDALSHISVEKADAQTLHSLNGNAGIFPGPTSTEGSTESTEKSPFVEFSTWNNSSQGYFSEPIPFSLAALEPDETEAVRLQDCSGRTAAEMIIPYPPGIPLLYPGERITEAAALRLQGLAQAGAKCQGAQDPKLRTILVFKNSRKQGNV
ncbi:aminotransferase class I/II-fold pyridoxal phosphate-dependent enzyme [Paenibacillus dokdonensis]|uniref:Aminotransferase class I/II-fold pyridoxal phosphate-dependent enzyme n=1 Tax=Paenibacillus dokdonensis TaxID=2567944 RepID=A0ABU6GWZ2_9BACL|nr:aminotransferase class I/II-fold pyridoxal phosphate-dependent enzyme [Paenibacillus dokdonensis]MEC0243788.1 aminotransferase class I/II-fold pyridoxal phosphate-dependent enzyme [Paenibacillus dokdonensis]